jgi:hypothetical protein
MMEYREHRMGNHLCRCRKNYEKELEAQGETLRHLVCRWNKHHQVIDVEFNHHDLICSDRHKTESERKFYMMISLYIF